MEQLTTERLILRPPCGEDARVMFERWTQDPEVTRYLPWRPHASVAQTEAFVQGSIAAFAEGRRLPFVITLRQDEPPIGMIELRLNAFSADFGYVLARSFWGRGYMTEAARTLVYHTLARPSIWRIWAVCDVDNPASARVLEKAGLQREGTLRRYIIHPSVSPEPRDVHLYARVR
jgi:[ribosomal protein S5]-alanine N-acetyltransferase